jgi:transposase
MEVSMKYTKEQQIDIGRQVYTHELSPREAAEKYGVGNTSVDNYVSMYKLANGIPTANVRINSRHADLADKKQSTASVPKKQANSSSYDLDIEAYRAMSKDELINELIKAKVNEARAKKGYEVKGDGTNKEYISLNSRNTKS